MPDMLVRLYDLPDSRPIMEEMRKVGIEIRHPIPPEKHIVLDWVRREFSEGWASECGVSFIHQPVACFIALERGKIVGFACYEATCRNFFGPMGVKESCRGRGIGKALLLASMEAMKAMGYAYAIIGGAGPVSFYQKSVGAVAIDGSVPGIYRGMLTQQE
ncbi:MAG: GNAT family N-acetyltransferase [Clostridia bacterium]